MVLNYKYYKRNRVLTLAKYFRININFINFMEYLRNVEIEIFVV